MKARSFLLVVLALAAACGTRRSAVPDPPPNPHNSEPIERQLLIREARLAGGAIVARLEIPLEPAGPKPTVLANLQEQTTLANAGIVVVTYRIDWGRLKGAPPPPRPASENTVGKWVLAAPSAAWVGEQYLKQIAATATVVIPKVVDYLVTVPEVDASRIAVTGASTNGFIALQAAAADPRIQVASVIAACGDYERFLRYSSMGMEGRELALDADYASWLHAQEVIHHPGRLLHAAVLMVNRVQDPLIPISCADETARVLALAYAAVDRRDRYRYVRVEDAEGHGLGPRENTEHLAWLRQWLRLEP